MEDLEIVEMLKRGESYATASVRSGKGFYHVRKVALQNGLRKILPETLDKYQKAYALHSEGKTNRDVAKALGISVSVVSEAIAIISTGKYGYCDKKTVIPVQKERASTEIEAKYKGLLLAQENQYEYLEKCYMEKEKEVAALKAKIEALEKQLLGEESA
jgi:uncharacterized protein YerC